MLLCTLLTASPLLSSPAYATPEEDALVRETTLARAAELNDNRVMEVPRAGKLHYYAQNNPLWARLQYEAPGSSSHRIFGDGGCCPTSAAIAIGAHLTDEQLTTIRDYAKCSGGYGVTEAVMNPLAPQSGGGIYWFTEAWEYREYLPLVFGSFAAGNNPTGEVWRAKPRQEGVSEGGTSNGFVPVLCQLYGLECFQLTGRYNMDWLSYVRRGATVVALANTQWQPFVKAKGHYVAIVAANDQYLYIMDPQNKQVYERDEKLWNILELVEPGLVRVKLENYDLLHFSILWVIRPPTPEKEPDALSPADWAEDRFAE